MTTTLPVQLDLKVYAGATFHKELRWKPDGTNPQDFTLWGAVMRVGYSRGTPVKVLSTATAGLALTSDGQIFVDLLPSETAAMGQGVYGYYLDLIDPQGVVIRFARGRVRVVKDVGP